MLEINHSFLSYINFERDSDDSIHGVAMVDILVNDNYGNYEADMASAGSFVWEGMSNFEGQREQSRVGFGLQGTAKEIQEIVETFVYRICSEIAEQTSHCAIQF
jgi:hypothetical protein